MTRTGRQLAVAGVFSVVLTGAPLVTPLRYAYESTELRIALETSQALVAALVAFVIFGLYRANQRSTDLALVYGFGVSAATNLFFALPGDGLHPIATSPEGRFQTWAPLLLRAVSTAAIAWAAIARPVPIRLGRPGATVVSAIAGTTIGVLVLATSVAELLPEGVTLEPTDTARLDVHGPPALLASQLVLTAAFATAAWGFARRADDDEPLLQALAAGCVLAAVARLHFFLYPSLYSDVVVHIGDVLRLVFYGVLLAGVARQIVLYWHTEAAAAAAEERRRMARELHDGLTQELSFIRSQSLGFEPGRSEPEALRHVADAADRAVSEARRLVGLLTLPAAGTLEEVLRASAARVGNRSGIIVEVQVDPGSRVSPRAYEELARVVAQATANAADHGQATGVFIGVRPSARGDLLTISDDGTGFDPERVRPGGHGLTSIRERVDRLGGTFEIATDTVGGTRLEIELPR